MTSVTGETEPSHDVPAQKLGEATSKRVQLEDVRTGWPELPTLAIHVRREGWQQRSMPVELTLLPDDIQVPSKLQHILNWSITPGSSWAIQPKSVEPADEADSITAFSARSNNEDAASIAPSISDVTRRSSVYDARSVVSPEPASDAGASTQPSKRAPFGKILNKFGRKKVAPLLESRKSEVLMAECVGCYEDLPVTLLSRLDACRHHYCKECLERHVTTAMRSESSFPPKCCHEPIPLHTVLRNLNDQQREEYQSKSAEYALAPNERWYCPRPQCAKWIPPSRLTLNRSANYNCPHCSEAICRTCRGIAHATGTECPQDFGLEQTLEVAELEGWQRCYSCTALVEHTYGCRHMTCKCRAEFCYVCGARWQTCQCTENDAQNRRADLNRRREERINIMNAELEEVARAIAEVQEMERRELEAEREREEQRLREEQEQLALLEQQRLEEEAARQAAEAEAERQWHEVIRTSFEDDFRMLQELVSKILGFQLSAMNSRHESKESAVAKESETRESSVAGKYGELLSKTSERYSERRKHIRAKHQEQVEALESQQEEQEDDMFVQIQVRLRGSKNKESRMERMLAELRKTQQEAKEDLSKTHTKDLYMLEVRKNVDLTGIKNAQIESTESTKFQLEQKLCKLGFIIGADREYFDIVAKRRLAMLDRHREVAMAEMQEKQEPHGLQDWQAALCEPYLPDPDEDEGAPGPSSSKHQHDGSVIEHTGELTSGAESYRRETTPRMTEPNNPPNTDNSDSLYHSANASTAVSSSGRDNFLQPIPPSSGHFPPSPPSSPAVSLEAPNAKRINHDTIRKLEDSTQYPFSPDSVGNNTVSQSSLRRPSEPHSGLIVTHGPTQVHMSVPPRHSRKDSTTTSIASMDSSEHRPSISSSHRKSSWFFGKKKTYTDEEIRQKMRNQSLGDAFGV